MKRARWQVLFWGFLLVVWIVSVGKGFRVLSNYANAPGVNVVRLQNWPQNTKLKLTSHQPTILFFAHPKCPCTKASLGELDILLAKIGGKAKTYVLFIQPKEWTDQDMQTDLVLKASSMPGVKVVRDLAGEEARRFGVRVSGHVIVFDPSGRMVFNGGVTGARGHAGDNAGRSAVVDYFQTGVVKVAKTKVFGCSLFNDEVFLEKQSRKLANE
jgi:hypothetical protein